MNRITTLALAAPLATVAFSLGATPAMAQPAEPPNGQISNAELVPSGPDDTAPMPEEQPEPQLPDGPGDISLPPCPTHGCGDGPDDGDKKEPGDKDPGDKLGIPVPKRIDAGTDSSEDGMELAWLLAGGAIITASGAAYAVRRRTRALA